MVVNGNNKTLGVIWLQVTIENEQSLSVCSNALYHRARVISFRMLLFASLTFY